MVAAHREYVVAIITVVAVVAAGVVVAYRCCGWLLLSSGLSLCGTVSIHKRVLTYYIIRDSDEDYPPWHGTDNKRRRQPFAVESASQQVVIKYQLSFHQILDILESRFPGKTES